MKTFLLLGFFFLLTSTATNNIFAQNINLTGTVYDYFSKRPLDGVTVQSTSGNHAISDSTGKFAISVTLSDSIYFTYFSKSTLKYPIDTISNLANFEIALYVDAAWLPEVKVRNRDYKLDSILNRQEYAKAFNFKKPGIQGITASPNTYVPGSVTAGMDLDAFINMFRFRRTRELLSMQQRLINEEQQKYINHRFTKYLVIKLTGLKGNQLDSFMSIARPSYNLLLTMNDLELGYYIQQMYKIYSNNMKEKSPAEKREDE